MASSLRRRLQVWYGLVMLGLVLVFGVMFYVRIRAERLGNLDNELTAAVDYLDANLRGFPARVLGAEDREPGDDDKPPAETPVLTEDEIRRYQSFLDFPERSGKAHPKSEGREDWFFAVIREDKRILKATPNVPVADLPRAPDSPILRPQFQNVGSMRQALMSGPYHSWIVVGKWMGPELGALRQLGLQLFGMGLVVVTVGLVGGWWISGRLVRPVKRMSEQAEAVSEKNLSQRINVEGIDEELIGLATALNTTFDRLEEAFAQQVQLTADASHELRTPLSVMRTQAELALSRPRSAEEYREALSGCLDAARRMSKLVDKLLTLARADSGQLLQKQDIVIFNTLIHEVVEELQPLAASRGVQLESKIAPAVVRGDATNLSRAAMNLVSNAIYYNKPDGRVFVEVRMDTKSVVLIVRDTGRGIPAEAQEQLFHRFFRADTSRARTSGGHGLGLAITKSIIDAHGGQIEFKSSEDQGTTFRVTLPACERTSAR